MSPQQQADPERYRNAWAALLQLVRDGRSWSGHERNRLFLNRGEGTFADISAVSGLDQAGDGRGLAIVDWDQDGDLDLWYRDRTAPRLRFMLNQYATPGARDFVAVKLEGTTGNRDGIGGVVEVITENAPGLLVKTVRAGDLFLSQSSRWLHFGLGQAEGIREIRVLWPGKKRWESFTGAKAGGAYLLKEGAAAVSVVERTARQISPPTKIASVPAPDPRARILLPARIPLPPLGFRNAAGQPQLIEGGGASKSRLIVLWSASCPHCRQELTALTEAAARIRSAALEVTALSVDGGGDNLDQAYNLIDSLKWPFSWGFLEADALDRLDEFQRALFDVTVPLAVPVTLLCDQGGNVGGLYRGGLDIESVLEDLAATQGADDSALHALAPPLAGRWFTKPVDPVYAAEFMARQFATRLPEDSLYYLAAARQRATGERQAALTRELADKHYHFARQYKAARNPDLAAAHFESALAVEPRAAFYLDYGTMAASYGNLADAQTLLEKALALEPGLQPARQALALVRKLIAEGK